MWETIQASPNRAGMSVGVGLSEIGALLDKNIGNLRQVALAQQAIRDEMRRRKVRFLPVQVTRRIIANMAINPFQLPDPAEAVKHFY